MLIHVYPYPGREFFGASVGTSWVQVDEGDEGISMVVPCRSTYSLWWLVRLITHDPPGDRVHRYPFGEHGSVPRRDVETPVPGPRKMSKLRDTRREAGDRGSTQRFSNNCLEGTREPKMAKLRTN